MANLAGNNVHNVAFKKAEFEQFSQLKTYYDDKYKIGWFLMNGAPRPCFTLQLLGEISQYHNQVRAEMAENQDKYDYLVVGSSVDSIFNLGGDLDLFQSLVKNKDRDLLFSYAIQCIDILYQNLFHLDLDLTTVSLIQGDALGGGLEAALSSNLVIAERGTKLGLPEVLFNLFPGMGAYTLISQRVNKSVAEEMIFSGKLYDAEELYEKGVIDILADPGEGELALYKYIKNVKRSPNTYKAMAKIKDLTNTVSYQELVDIANIWADTALLLTKKDLRMMERLVSRQNVKVS